MAGGDTTGAGSYFANQNVYELSWASALPVPEIGAATRTQIASVRPNPGREAQTIDLELSALDGPASLEIVAVDGRRVWARTSCSLPPRAIAAAINGRRVSLYAAAIDALPKDDFTQTHAIKSHFRNSWNDLLILAVAANAHGQLLTEDALLARFAADILRGRTLPDTAWLTLSFPPAGSHTRRNRRIGNAASA